MKKENLDGGNKFSIVKEARGSSSAPPCQQPNATEKLGLCLLEGCLRLQHFHRKQTKQASFLGCEFLEKVDSRVWSVVYYLEASRNAMPRGQSQEEVQSWPRECKQPRDRDVTDCPISSSSSLLQALC